MFNRFFQKTKKPVEYFVALKITEFRIGAAVFTIEDKKAKIINLSFENFDSDWKNIVEAADLAISKACGEIDLNKIKKVVFGLPPSFLDGDKIHGDKLFHLKKITSELELIPSGFVVIPEAINFYLETKENSPQTNILLGITKTNLITSLFRGGKLTDQVIIPRTNDINKDVQASLEKLTSVEIFPSKILIYDGGDLETIKEELLKYPWQNNSKFLHFPKIETLPPDFCLRAVVESAVFELKYSFETTVQKETTPILPEETRSEKEYKIKKVPPESLGFFKESQEVKTPQEPLEAEKTRKGGIKLPRIKPLNISWPAVKLPNMGKIGFLILTLFLFFVILGGGYIFASYSLPKARLILIVDPKTFSQEKEVTINPDIIALSESRDEIPGKILEVEVSGTKTIPTTGKKVIGEEAKGTVTIYNKTTIARTFEKGTKISAKNLEFRLDDKTEVPAASETVEGLTYGKANITVTAVKIGPEGNLPAQTEFTIEDFSTSSYLARNDQAFSGGTSREVNSVSSKDQENLLSQLKEELKEQAKKDLLAKLTGEEKLLDESLDDEVKTRKFSAEVDQEAKELTLNLTAKYQGMIYQEKDFAALMEKILSNNIPQGYEFRPTETTLSVSESQSDNKTFKFKALFTARLFPKIDTEKIKKEIAGLPAEKLESYMKTVPNLAGYEIKFESPFSFMNRHLPRLSKNLIIEIKAR